MSLVHILVTGTQNCFLTKERFLSFDEIMLAKDCFVYLRYDYRGAIISHSANDKYRLLSDTKNLFQKLLSLDRHGFYWATQTLCNKMGDNEVIGACLNLIHSENYTRKIDFEDFVYDKVYKITSG